MRFFLFVCFIERLWKALSGCDCLIIFEWRVYVVQRCVSVGDDGNGVCGLWWVVGCVCVGACRGADGRQSMSSRGMSV